MYSFFFVFFFQKPADSLKHGDNFLVHNPKIKAGHYIDIVSYRDMRQDIVTDFGYRYMVWVLSFPGWKSFIPVKHCGFLNLPDCCRDPHIHLTDDYLSKNVIRLIFCEITNSHPHSTVSIEVFDQKYCDFYSFYHLSSSHNLKCTTRLP